jgi:hypothetical protein
MLPIGIETGVQYQDFFIKLRWSEGRRYSVHAESEAGEDSSSFLLPADLERRAAVALGRHLGNLRHLSAEEAQEDTPSRLEQIGGELFGLLFSGGVRTVYERAKGRLESRRSKEGLRIRLQIDPRFPELARLHGLPWELLCTPEETDLLGLSCSQTLVRYLEVARGHEDLPPSVPLHILAVMADPSVSGTARLDLEQELAHLEAACRVSGDIRLSFLKKASLTSLHQRLSAGPVHVLHFMGHGDFDEATGEGTLLFEEPDGRPCPIAGKKLAKLIKNFPQVRLVMLNACNTARAARDDGLQPFWGMATALVEGGVPAVLAMQIPIADGAAIAFSRMFYYCLAQGNPVDAAAAQGRLAIYLSDHLSPQWAAPVLFLRASDGLIFAPPDLSAESRPRHLRVFLSSPGDVTTERAIVREVLASLPRDPLLRGQVTFEVVSWDDPTAPNPMSAQLSPQEAVERGLPQPSQCDLTVVILWGRIATPQEPRKLSGNLYLSGTEYEFENARAAGKTVWLYRRTGKIPVTLDDPDLDAKRTQKALVDQFFQQFQNDDGSPSGGYNTYEDPPAFRGQFESNMRVFLRGLLESAGPADGSVTLMKSLLMAVRESVSAIRMPLPTRDGHAVLLRSADFRVDLPLRFVHDHRPKREPLKSEPTPSLQVDGSPGDLSPHAVTNLDLSFDLERRSHTDLLLQERSVRAESVGGNWSLSEHLAPESRLIVWGDPGSGKSTLLDWITGHYAGAWLGESGGDAALPVQPWIPVLVACRDIVEALPIGQVTELFEVYVRRRQFNPDQVASIVSYLGQAMDSGSVLLMVDGIDEILDRHKRFELCRLLRDIANRFSRAPIIATSRVIGLQDVRAELSDCFDFIEVLPLQRGTKYEYVGRWARLNGLNDAATYDLIESVCYGRASSRLTDNILMLAMVSQLQTTRETAPQRSIDVLRRAVQLMTERRHHMPGGSFESSVVIAYLEFLAYLMRKAGLQRYADNRVLRVFEDFRSASSDEPAFVSIEPAPLLEACIHVFGLLNVAGVETDTRGIDRRSIQFVHQLFQEYLAGQAIRHGRGAPTEQGVVARLRQYFDALRLEPREIVVSEHNRVTESVVVGDWQEQIRSAIADLATSEADDAMQMILPGSDAPAAEARARAVFAMLCLAEDPRVSDRVASVAVDTAIDALIDEDAFNLKINTSMDEAFAALSKSTFDELLRARLLDAFGDGHGVRRLRAGRGFVNVAALPQAQLTDQSAGELLEERVARLRSDTATVRIGAALELMQLFFSVNGKLGFLPETLRDAIFEGLTELLRKEEGSRCAALWALVWFTNAMYRGVGETAPGEVAGVRPMTAANVRACLSLGQLDPSFVPHACDALTREEGLRLVCHQQDWIYELAVVADGVKPRRELADPAPTGADASTMDLMAAQLRLPDLSESSRSRVALALGRLGVRTSEMVRPLCALFEDPRRWMEQQRDEALVYLALIGGAEARLALENAHATAPAGKDDYLFSRGLFGLLLLDDVEVLAKHLRMALDHFDLRALARGLLGSRDPKGQELLGELKREGDRRVVAAIDAALAGKVVPAPGNAAKTVCVLLVRGQNPEGAPIFAYVAVRGDKLSEFMKSQESGMFYPEDFGVIVESGEGEPSEEIRRRMETEYGFNHDGMTDIPDASSAESIIESLEGGLRPETD